MLYSAGPRLSLMWVRCIAKPWFRKHSSSHAWRHKSAASLVRGLKCRTPVSKQDISQWRWRSTSSEQASSNWVFEACWIGVGCMVWSSEAHLLVPRTLRGLPYEEKESTADLSDFSWDHQHPLLAYAERCITFLLWQHSTVTRSIGTHLPLELELSKLENLIKLTPIVE